MYIHYSGTNCNDAGKRPQQNMHAYTTSKGLHVPTRNPVSGCKAVGPQNDQGEERVYPPSGHGSTNSKFFGAVIEEPRGAARVGSFGRVHEIGESSPWALKSQNARDFIH